MAGESYDLYLTTLSPIHIGLENHIAVVNLFQLKLKVKDKLSK